MEIEIQKKLALLRARIASAEIEKQLTHAGILNSNETVDTPGEVKDIYNNDGPANTDFKSRARLKSRIGPIDTESELIEQQHLKPR